MALSGSVNGSLKNLKLKTQSGIRYKFLTKRPQAPIRCFQGKSSYGCNKRSYIRLFCTSRCRISQIKLSYVHIIHDEYSMARVIRKNTPGNNVNCTLFTVL